MSKSGKIIGIDLGTTNSCVAVLEGTTPTVITNSAGGRTTPSVVGFGKNNARLIGEAARRQAVTNPKNTIYGVKRLIGKKFTDPKIQATRSNLSYDVVAASNGDAWVHADGKNQSPEQISAMILAEMKKAAEDYLGETVTRAVITVPAHFNDEQRQATKNAGKIAGLEVERIINEPTAAALAYGLDKKQKGNIVIYDLGGGTFDVSILELSEGLFEVKSTDGDTHLGGEDFDDAIINWMADEFNRQHNYDLRKDAQASQRLKEAAEKAKKELSSAQETQINLPYILGDKHLELNLTRSKLENLVLHLIEKTIEPCKRALSDAKLKIDEITEVILVGGMTRMPKVQEAVEKFFGKKAQKGVNPDEVVALGAATQAGIMTGAITDVLLLDVIPLSVGIETMGGVFTKMIEKNTTIPNKKSQTFSTAADNQHAVSIRVAQGERSMFADNKVLGEFTLDGIAPAPRGVPQIEVTFDIDANGILNVSAKDKNTGKEQRVTVKSDSGLNKEEIEKAIREAEAHAAEDAKRKEVIEVKNQADNLIYTTEKSLKENDAKLTQQIKDEVNQDIAQLRSAITAENLEQIKSALEKLTQSSMKIGEAVYKQNDQNANQTSGSQGENAGYESSSSSNQTNPENEKGKVVDGEYK